MNDRPPESCVTEWLGQLKAGDKAAAQRIWEGYFVKLVGLVRPRLRATPRAAADEEDVVLSVFDSFFRGAAQGRFPRLDDRNDLWQVLIVLASRKAVGLARHEGRQKRGGGRVVQASAMEDGDTGNSPLGGACDREPTPEEAALVAEECERLLGGLNDETLREIARWKMEGYSNAEIAAKIGRVEGTVERKLALIRDLWAGEPRT